MLVRRGWEEVRWVHCIIEDCDGCVSESLEMVGVGLLVGNGKGLGGCVNGG